MGLIAIWSASRESRNEIAPRTTLTTNCGGRMEGGGVGLRGGVGIEYTNK